MENNTFLSALFFVRYLLSTINQNLQTPTTIGSNICATNFLRQENFLKSLQDQLADDSGAAALQHTLDNLRTSLLNTNQTRFYMCADLKRLSRSLAPLTLDTAWTRHFPAGLTFNTRPLFTSNKPFTVAPVWTFKKTYESDLRALLSKDNTTTGRVFSQMPKRDFLVNLGTSDSAYLRLVSSLDINSYHHASYAGLLVLIEYFCQTEGPLWEAVRGPGYAYGQSMHLSPELASLELQLDECSNLTKAYEATRKTFADHLSRRNGFDPNLLETAKNSLIFQLIDDLKSVSSTSAYSMSCLFKGVDLEAVP